MRYLVFGDIHGNIDALDTVLAAAKTLDVTVYLCLGDVVGYGPCPLECLERIAALQRAGRFAWVAGNHELALRDEVDWRAYSPEAIQTLEWTRSVLQSWRWARELVESSLPTSQVNQQIWLTHDSLAEPSNGRYHREALDAKKELIALWRQGGRVCFYGHTHTQRAEVLRPGELLTPAVAPHGAAGRDPAPWLLTGGELGWFGAGSVGFPTNPERRTEFLVLDDDDSGVWKAEKYALPYPRAKARERAQSVLTAKCGTEVAARIVRWL